MESDVYRRIESSANFRELVGARTRFAVTLTVIMLVIYCAFILAVAFAPGWLGAGATGAALALGLPRFASAAEAIQGGGMAASTNWSAIGIFLAFVLLTLFITKWAASRTKSAADFYAAGGGISGFQNGLAIAGDYMSAASFLGL